ncbi:hypothetical protein QBC42DRAFT_262527 [Cladorrhinum samala]|uniref:Uncharacterized protein n=1 Tax=Cladorrhinum samala TaxID=585594 RepID=A0AAV9HVY3_9PEZI|nr:hypothetical protein QBC42DRAFT_262527 [Cladorrhinum samala]
MEAARRSQGSSLSLMVLVSLSISFFLSILSFPGTPFPSPYHSLLTPPSHPLPLLLLRVTREINKRGSVHSLDKAPGNETMENGWMDATQMGSERGITRANKKPTAIKFMERKSFFPHVLFDPIFFSWPFLPTNSVKGPGPSWG